MVIRTHFEMDETAVTIVSEPEFVHIAKDAILDAREEIKRFIRTDPIFLNTLEPYDPPSGIHPIIKRMCDASRPAGVGPMATVAGVIAEEAVRAMVKRGARQAIVDNGGDIAFYLSEPVTVGLYAGESDVKDLGFRCEPRNSIFGICTSSGTVGPSISFGISDAATVVSEEVALADACATYLGNLVTSADNGVLMGALDRVCAIEGVEGAIVIIGDKIAVKGSIPKLVGSEVRIRDIAKRDLSF
ncbi:MAG: UPF0280 family protein [Methanomassiliicoccales archaeon]|jgi:ApbE superfamily uncharacterized protein (UPF0280 family)